MEDSSFELSILTYNVNFALCRNNPPLSNGSNVIKAITESNADIIALQETHNGFKNQLEKIKNIYPFQEFYSHPAAGGQGFLSKYELNNHKQINVQDKIEGSWFPIHTIDVKFPINNSNEYKYLTLVNVHLRPPVNPNGSANIFTARNTNKYRLQEVKYLSESLQWKLPFPYPIIILGDFNENDSSPALSYLQQQFHFTDAVHEFIPQNRETHRWRILWGYWLLLKRLDHILYSNDIICKSCNVIDGYEENASDHQPVIANIEITYK